MPTVFLLASHNVGSKSLKVFNTFYFFVSFLINEDGPFFSTMITCVPSHLWSYQPSPEEAAE